jgi:ABC-type phosphate transport system permease subunit
LNVFSLFSCEIEPGLIADLIATKKSLSTFLRSIFTIFFRLINLSFFRVSNSLFTDDYYSVTSIQVTEFFKSSKWSPKNPFLQVYLLRLSKWQEHAGIASRMFKQDLSSTCKFIFLKIYLQVLARSRKSDLLDPA